MKHQALFSSKGKSKKLKSRLLLFLFGALRVNIQDVVKIQSRIIHVYSIPVCVQYYYCISRHMIHLHKESKFKQSFR